MSNKPTYIVLDVETTINNHKLIRTNPIDRPAADVWAAGNRIVMLGYKILGAGNPSHIFDVINTSKTVSVIAKLRTLTNPVIVGINLPFDIGHISRNLGSSAWMDDFQFYDLQIMEYMITGQRSKFPSMRSMGEKYKIDTPKDDYIKTTYWDRGINTNLIPTEELQEYLHTDLIATEEIFLAQREELIRVMHKHPDFENFFALVQESMEAMANSCRMEARPFIVDTTIIAANASKLDDEIVRLVKEASRLLPHLTSGFFDVEDQDIFKPTYFKHFIYGHEIEHKQKIPMIKDGKVVKYKTGPNKGTPRTIKRLQILAMATHQLSVQILHG